VNTATPPTSRSRKNRRSPLGREAWLRAAREALIRDGIQGVEIGKLARRLKVTRGGFYWFFDSRRQLLDELLADWERTNNIAFVQFMERTLESGEDEFNLLAEAWITEERYSPAWDSAVRDWARVSTKVANAVRRIDDGRIDIMKGIFLRMGYPEQEAFVRARIAYFHQVGYYALGVKESRAERERLLPLYLKALKGR
jgi:AcrR family transcriptional regulator